MFRQPILQKNVKNVKSVVTKQAKAHTNTQTQGNKSIFGVEDWPKRSVAGPPIMSYVNQVALQFLYHHQRGGNPGLLGVALLSGLQDIAFPVRLGVELEAGFEGTQLSSAICDCPISTFWPFWAHSVRIHLNKKSKPLGINTIQNP